MRLVKREDDCDVGGGETVDPDGDVGGGDVGDSVVLAEGDAGTTADRASAT